MPDPCDEPTRECPFDTNTIKSFGRMEQKLKDQDQVMANIYKAVTNGNGLIQRMGKVELFIAGLNAERRMWRFVIPMASATLTALAMKLFGV